METNSASESNPFIGQLAPSSGVQPTLDAIRAKHMGNPDEPKVERRGGTRPGAGRKKSIPVEAPSVESTAPPIDVELIRKTVAGLLKAVDSIVCRRIYGVSMLVSDGDKQFANGVTVEVALTVDEQEIIASLSAEICRKYELLGQYAPELLLGVALLGYSTRIVLASNKLKEMAELRRLKARNESRPLSNKDSSDRP